MYSESIPGCWSGWTRATPGWGECVAEESPTYAPEYVEGVADVIRRFLVPRLAAAGTFTAPDVAVLFGDVRGHQMAKSAVEMAVLDAELWAQGVSLATYLGRIRSAVPAGVSVSIRDSIPDLLDEVAEHLDAGYRRIKLKIEPGWDIEPVRVVRERSGSDVVLQVDANTAYQRGDERHPAALDDYGLLLIEQPYAPEDLLGHGELSRRLSTPICLDESITSAQSAAAAITLGACSSINIKPGRVGGYLEARRIHDVARAHGVQVWCGGMSEDGARARRQRRARISAGLHSRQRHLGHRALLRAGHHGTVRPARRPHHRAHRSRLGVDVAQDVLDEFTVSTELLRS